MNTGLTHIYTGDGKGKTTAALGLCLRAAGNGLTVRLYQFCKNTPSGELKPLAALPGVEIHRAENQCRKFVWDMTPSEKAEWIDAQQALFDEACEAALDKSVDLVVLDEALGAMAAGAIELSQLIYLIEHKNKGTELVLTGRNAPQKLIEKADYVTEMRALRHPYEQGVHARKGIEY